MAEHSCRQIMKNKLSIIILDSKGSPVRQLTASRLAVSVSLILLVIFIVGSMALIWDYNEKRQKLSQRGVLQKALAEKQAVIRQQKRHIESFVTQLANLSQNIAELKRFESEIRVVANLEPNHDQESVFGIGGSAGEGFKTDIESEKNKNGIEINRIEQSSSHSIIQDQKRTFEMLLEQSESMPNMLASTPSIRPADGQIVTGFERRKSLLTDREEFNQGLDIVNEKGTPVIATADGQVTFSGFKPTTGQTLIIDHGFGFVTEYDHLDSILKQVGEQVKRGEQIATMGESGQADTPHLHYEVHLNGIPVNPSRYILQ